MFWVTWCKLLVGPYAGATVGRCVRPQRESGALRLGTQEGQPDQSTDKRHDPQTVKPRLYPSAADAAPSITLPMR